MSTQITTAFVKNYQDTVVMLSQQQGSRLQDKVMMKSGIRADEAFFDRIGSTAMVLKSGRHADTPQIDTPHSRRRVTANDYVWADLVDREDEVRTIIEPTSRYAVNAAWAAGRQRDQVIIDAATGNAFGGVDGSTTIALPAGQKIAVAAAGLNKAKLISAKKILDQNEVDPNDPRFCVVTAEQLEDLLGENETISADFNTVRALVQGEIDTWLGFKFVRTELLNTDGSGDRQVIAYAKSGLGLCVVGDLVTSIDRRTDKNNATQVHLMQTVGATRIEDEKVVEIACSE